MKNWYRYCTLILAMWCGMASAFPPTQIVKKYFYVHSDFDVNLGLAAGSSIPAIIHIGRSLRANGGSIYEFVYSGSTTATNCTQAAGNNVITSSSACAPGGCSVKEVVTTCSGGNIVITLYKGTNAWANPAMSVSQTDVVGPILRVFAQVAGASSSNPSTCISSSSAGKETFIRNRGQFCNQELSQFKTAGVFKPYYRNFVATPLNPSPSADWHEDQTATGYLDLAGRGTFDSANTRLTVFGSDFAPTFYIDWTSSHVMRYDGTQFGAGTVYDTGVVSYRRPTIVSVLSKGELWMFAHDIAYNDRVKLYTTTDQGYTWTDRGDIVQYPSPFGSGALTPYLSTLLPVAAAYDYHTGTVMLAAVDYGSWNLSYCGTSTGCAGQIILMAMDINSYTVSVKLDNFGQQNLRRQTGRYWVGATDYPALTATVPAIVCEPRTDGCTEANDDRFPCMVLSTRVNTLSSARDIWAITFWLGNTSASVGTWGWDNGYQNPGGETFFGLSGTDLGFNKTGQNIIAVKGTDDNLYLNKRTPISNAPPNCSTYTPGPANPFGGWAWITNTSEGILAKTDTSPSIRYNPAANRYQINVGCDFGGPHGCGDVYFPPP